MNHYKALTLLALQEQQLDSAANCKQHEFYGFCTLADWTGFYENSAHRAKETEGIAQPEPVDQKAPPSSRKNPAATCS